MKIAIDVSPLKKDHFIQHRVRGTGFYIENLNKALKEYFPQHTYMLFTRGEKLPKGVDLVHYPYLEPFFLTLPFIKGLPTVVTIHDLTPLVFPTHFPRGIRGEIKWQLQKLSLRGVNAVITDSNASKNDIVKYAGISPKYIHVVYLATSEEFKHIGDSSKLSHIRAKYKLPKKFVLYVGDATWNKNLPRLVEAIKKINLTLVMVGKALVDTDFDKENPWNQDLFLTQKLAQGDKRIIRLGFVPTDDLVAIYNAATVFTMPSIYEGFGLPILEAMASEVPVVTTKSGSLSEVAGDAVKYVDSQSVDSIADGIKEVFFSRELRGRLTKEGFRQAKKFSWKETAEKTIEVYEKVLEK